MNEWSAVGSQLENSCLIVIDVQNNVVKDAVRRDEVVSNIATLVDRAREQSVPVIWVRHHDDGLVTDSAGWQIVPELVPAAGEAIIEKAYGDSFEDTSLAETLNDLGVNRLFVTGAQTDQCIRSTLHGALARGFHTILVSDAHTTEDLSQYGVPPAEGVIAHTNLYWHYQRVPGREAGTVSTEELFV